MSERVRAGGRPHLLFAYGTRPEAIKLAPVILRAKEVARTTVCATGQHDDLVDDVQRLFGIVPDVNLRLMCKSQRPESFLSLAIETIAPFLRELRPDALVVQGDTTTTLAAALSGFYARVPVGHVEAGLRSGNLDAPFPEELHRQVVARAARWHFAPTGLAAENLRRDGIVENIYITGNTSIDAIGLLRAASRPRVAWRDAVGSTAAPRLVLVTAHRRESVGKPFERICDGLIEIADRFSDTEFAFVLHPNPAFLEFAKARLAGHARIRAVPPLALDHLYALLDSAWAVMTDSGGLQEEASAFGKPVLVLRDESDRPETVSSGNAALVGRDPARMMAAFERLRDPALYQRASAAKTPYGDGRASERIVERLLLDCSTDASGSAAPSPSPFPSDPNEGWPASAQLSPEVASQS